MATGLHRLGILAPASPFPAERFEAGLNVLRQLGFQPVIHYQAYAKTGYLAGSDADRLNALYDLLADPSIDAVMAARGGYGIHRLLEHLDRRRLQGALKPVIGFSDVTALHAVWAQLGQASLHGPVVTQLADLPAADQEVFAQALAGAPGLRYLGQTTVHPGRAAGPLFGGCLSVLVPLLGTPYFPSLAGKILLLEDVGEVPYRIDRMLTHLRLSGALSQVAGIAVGEWVKCEPARAGEPTAVEVLAERTADLGVPVLYGLPFGHGQTNRAVWLGAEVELDADARTLTVLP